MVVVGVEGLDMERDPRIHGEGLEPFAHQFVSNSPIFGAVKFTFHTRKAGHDTSIAARVSVPSMGRYTLA